MTMAAFQDAALEYADAGIVPLPIDGKRPLVKHPDRFRRRAALQIAAKPQFANAALGFWCGHFNGLSVVDVDSTADAELQYALNTYGDSPIIVKTASGKFHAWYRHDGERRLIRPDKSHPIDILGGGICVAPPSARPSGGKYAFLRGGLSDRANLPKIRIGALPKSSKSEFHHRALADPVNPSVNPPNSSATIEEGERAVRLLKITCALARDAKTKPELLEQSREANAAMCKPPLSDAEVQRAVGSAWGYKMADRLMVAGTDSSIVIPRASIAQLLTAGAVNAHALLTLLRTEHSGRRDVFAASPEAMAHARLIGSWGKNRYRDAIRKLCDVGELE